MNVEIPQRDFLGNIHNKISQITSGAFYAPLV